MAPRVARARGPGFARTKPSAKLDGDSSRKGSRPGVRANLDDSSRRPARPAAVDNDGVSAAIWRLWIRLWIIALLTI